MHSKEQLVAEWRKRARIYEAAAGLARRDGDPDAVDDYTAAADDYWQAANDLEALGGIAEAA